MLEKSESYAQLFSDYAVDVVEAFRIMLGIDQHTAVTHAALAELVEAVHYAIEKGLVGTGMIPLHLVESIRKQEDRLMRMEYPTDSPVQRIFDTYPWDLLDMATTKRVLPAAIGTALEAYNQPMTTSDLLVLFWPMARRSIHSTAKVARLRAVINAHRRVSPHWDAMNLFWRLKKGDEK